MPLKEGGYGIGIVARMDGRGCVLGFFFGPAMIEIPTLDELEKLSPEQAILIAQFGHLGLTQGRWPILGRSGEWNKDSWPMPLFIRVSKPGCVAYLTKYSDDTLEAVSEQECDISELPNYPYDRLYGATALERQLSRLLVDG